ncbi:hypothetical protein CEP52_016174 [Fusarium oligoseptatum]|uniref:Uncharacterized protein n=1 Tax=Fusarium oligoseptatum TaxID=2604345 RepID=A0A428S6H2_9HYPO|nr:hypothetical protein CEP52_016174 [Fusarium oligoseptatum]
MLAHHTERPVRWVARFPSQSQRLLSYIAASIPSVLTQQLAGRLSLHRRKNRRCFYPYRVLVAQMTRAGQSGLDLSGRWAHHHGYLICGDSARPQQLGD